MSVNLFLSSHTSRVPFTKHLLRLGSTAFFLFLFTLIWSHPAQAATCTWTGTSSTDWNTAGNWSGCGGVVPSNSDSVTIPNVANDPIVSTDATVAALDLGFGGSLTINSGQTLTVEGLSTFAVSSISGSGVFSTASLNLNAGCCSGAITLNANLTVGQAMTVTDVGAVNGSAINILGNFRSNDSDLTGTTIFRLAGSDDQTLTGSGRVHNLDIAKSGGDVLIPSNFSINGGTFTGTGSRLKSIGGAIIFGVETISFTGSIDDVALNAGCCFGAITLNADLTVNNSLRITDVQQVNGKVIAIGGNLASNDADLAGTTVFRLNGTGDQTLTGVGRLHNLDIAKPSGDVLIPSNFNISGGTFSGTSGHLVSTGGTIIFGPQTISFTGSIDDVAINAGCCTGSVVTLNADLTVNNSLIVTDVQQINGKVINIGGNFRSSDGDLAGTTIFRLNGSGDQTLTGVGRVNNLDIAKPSGDVLIPSNFNISGGTFSGTSGHLVSTGGTIIFGPQTISFTGSIDDVAINAGCCTGAVVTLNADLTVNNSLIMTDVQQINGKAINIGGNFRSSDGDLLGTTVFRLNGTGDQILTGIGRVNNLDIAKPSGDVLIPSNFNISGGTFSGASGHLVNTGGTIIFGPQTISFTGSIDDVAINAGCCTGAVVTLNADLTVNNSLIMTDVQQINGKAINIGGNFRSSDGDLLGTTIFRLNGTGDQTLTGVGRVNNLDIAKPSGDVLIPSNFNISGGTFSGASGHLVNTGGTIIFGPQTISFTGSIDDVAINAGCCTGAVVTLNADLTVNNSLIMTDVQQINGKAINIGGTFRSSDGDLLGTTIFRLNGTGDQTLTGIGRVHNLDIAKPSGDVLIPSNFTVSGGAFTGAGSRLRSTGGAIIFGAETISFTGSIDDVNILAASNQNLTLNADLTVNNNLTVTQVFQVLGKTISIGGNLVSNDGDLLGTTVFRLAGSGDQTLTGVGIINNLDIAKPSGDVLIPSNFIVSGGSFTGTGSRVKNMGGAIVFGSETVSFTGSIDDVNILAASNQNLTLNADLTVNNNLTVTQVFQVLGKAISIGGNLVSNDGDLFGTTVFRLAGSGDQTLTGTGIINNLEVAKTGGQVLFTGNRTFSSVVISSGTFGPNGFTVTSPVTVNGGTLGGQGKIVGAVTVNSGGTLNAGSSPGRLDLQGNLVMNSGSNLFVDINGNTPGSEHDQVVVTGTVTINSATLTGTTGIAPSQAITILANDNTDAIAGTRFVNAPNTGNSISIGNTNYQIAYNGGSGNDIVLNLPPPSGLQVVNSSPTMLGGATEFTATLSVGSGVNYTWNFGDGTSPVSGASAAVSHTYATINTYTTIVTATNAQGSVSASTAVTVTPNGQVVETVTPGTAKTLVYNAQDGAVVTVEVPGATITQSLYLVYNSVVTPTTAPAYLLFGNRSFHLEAWLGNQLLPGISFNPPLTLTLDYLASDVNGLNENQLELYYYDTTSNQWSNAGMTVVERDTVNHRIVVLLSHLTEFALFQPKSAPVAGHDIYTTTEDTVLQVAAPGVLTNDSDADNDPLTLSLVSDVASGSLSLDADGGFIYTPTTDFNGQVSFTYLIDDGIFTATATSTISVTPVNDPPQVSAIADQSIDESTPFSLAVVANDVDLPAQNLSFSLEAGAPTGTTVDNNGLFAWTPSEAQGPGVYPIGVRVSDDGTPSLSTTVNFTLTVNEINQPPVVSNDADLTLINTPLSVYAPGVLANDSDPDGTTLTAQLVTAPAHGVATIASNGGFVYTPTTDYTGMDSFDYTASDGQYAVTGTVTINVFQTGSNPAPIVLPEAGWNLFGYPLANSHLVTEVLASISGTYTTVFGYDASDPNDPWRMYDPSIPAPFDTILNRLTSFAYGQGYWINLAQPATITLPSSLVAATSAGLDAKAMTPQPPATFYGELSSKGNFVPHAGMAVEAWVGDTLCGQSTTQVTSEGRVIYALHVQAAGSGNLQNCGVTGRNVTLRVDGLLLTTLPWSNESLQQVTTMQPEEQPTANKHVFLPIVANR
ncbi:MAG: Ig-like domain-containing protein [Caldilineaceae bacterium]